MRQDTTTIFRNGASQAVRLPKAFRLPGRVAWVRKVGQGVLLEPVESSLSDWFHQLDKAGADTLLASGRRQPRAPRRRIDL